MARVLERDLDIDMLFRPTPIVNNQLGWARPTPHTISMACKLGIHSAAGNSGVWAGVNNMC